MEGLTGLGPFRPALNPGQTETPILALGRTDENTQQEPYGQQETRKPGWTADGGKIPEMTWRIR